MKIGKTCICFRVISFFVFLMLTACGGGNPIIRNVVRGLQINPLPLPAPGDTIANAELQEDVLNLLLARDGSLNKTCKTYGLRTTEVTEPPPGAEQKWKERWILDRCGVPVRYDVEFAPHPQGGTNIGISGPLQ